jgi:hypothetical protein
MPFELPFQPLRDTLKTLLDLGVAGRGNVFMGKGEALL